MDLLFDWFGLVCFANKNKNCQLSCSWFQTSQTGGQWYSDTSPFSIPCSGPVQPLLCNSALYIIPISDWMIEWLNQGILKGEVSCTVLLTSCVTGLDKSVLQTKTKIVSCLTAHSKPVKQEVNSTVMLPTLVFPAQGHYNRYPSTEPCTSSLRDYCQWLNQRILKGEVSLYCWPPVWLVWISRFANKNKNCQLSYSWFQTSQTGGERDSDTYPFSIPCPEV